MNSLFTLGLMIGISVNDLTVGTIIANLGMTEVKFPAPLFQGDTIRVTTEIVGKRESRSRPEAGIVEFLHRAYKHDGTLVAECRRQVMMRKRPCRRHDRLAMRSLLFVPADSERKIAKARASEADVVILDLEDSVAAAAKPEARRIAAAVLAGGAAATALFVRVNTFQSGHLEADIEALRRHAPDGLVLPKPRSGEDVRAPGRTSLGAPPADHRHRHRNGRFPVRHGELCARRRISLAGLAWGGEDLATELGAARNRDDGRLVTPSPIASPAPCACWAPAMPVSSRSTPSTPTSAISLDSRPRPRKRRGTASPPSSPSTPTRCR